MYVCSMNLATYSSRCMHMNSHCLPLSSEAVYSPKLLFLLHNRMVVYALYNAPRWRLKTCYGTRLTKAMPLCALPIHFRAVNVVLDETMTFIWEQLVATRCRTIFDSAPIIQGAILQKCGFTLRQASLNGVRFAANTFCFIQRCKYRQETLITAWQLKFAIRYAILVCAHWIYKCTY